MYVLLFLLREKVSLIYLNIKQLKNGDSAVFKKFCNTKQWVSTPTENKAVGPRGLA